MGFSAAPPLGHNSHGLTKAMDSCDDNAYPALAARYSELFSALGESEKHQDTTDLIDQRNTHTSVAVREYMNTGIRKLGEEGICVSPASAISHQRNNTLRCS